MIVLASASPRRARLLEEAGIRHTVRTVDVDESPPGGADPLHAARSIAERKARAGVARHPTGLVLGADTIVVLDGRILGKPRDREDARATLSALSGRTHEVITGLCLLDAATGTMRVRAVSTRVSFRALAAAEIEAYVASGEPMDKAGAYGIQGAAGAFVASIEGSFDNVVGLPVDAVREMMEELT